MRGVGEATGAITIVNALPTRRGCAIGIDLRVTAEAEVEVPRTGASQLRLPEEQSTPVARAALELAVARWGSGDPLRAEVSLGANLPAGTGLKSSSAVASAILVAVARALGRSPSALEVARASAEVGRTSGVSATGAFDDALAGLLPGFVVTDNSTDSLIRRAPPPAGLGVLLFVPEGRHPPAPTVLPQFHERAVESGRALEAALAGAWWEAMSLNSSLVEATMGYDYGPTRARLRERGAVGVGVSGLGPTLAAVAPADALPRLGVLGPSGARTVSCTFSTRPQATLEGLR